MCWNFKNSSLDPDLQCYNIFCIFAVKLIP